MSAAIERALRGRVVPAVPVPFRDQARINDEAHRSYARWMAAQPIGGVALWAHTGRGLHLSDEQRADVLRVWRTEAPGLPVICGVGAPLAGLPNDPLKRTRAVLTRTVAMARAAHAGGAHAVMVHPPTALRGVPELERHVLDLHRAVAEVGLPVLAFYLYEAAGGISYAQATIEELLASPGVVGIKLATLDSVMTFQDLAAVVTHVPGALLITGEDRFLGYSLSLGAHGALIGMAAACTRNSVAVLDSWFARAWPAFMEHSTAIDAFARATFLAPMEGYVQRMLWALEADGVLESEALDPFGPDLGSADRDRVRAAVRALKSLATA